MKNKYAGRTMAKKLSLLQEVIDHLDSYIYVVNVETFEVIFMNKKVKRSFKNLEKKEPCYHFFRGKDFQCGDCPILNLSGDVWDKTTQEIYNDRLKMWTETSATQLQRQDGTVVALVNCSDITRQKEEYQQYIDQLRKIAYVDELTGGRTYYKFKEDAQRILEQRAERTHFLVKFDIDNFKLVNEIYGYNKGNELLCVIAKALEQTTRGEYEIFSRIVNDEFIALFELQNPLEYVELYERFLINFHAMIGSDFVFKWDFPQGRYIIQKNNTEKIDMADIFEKVNLAHKTAKMDKMKRVAVYNENMTLEALHKKEIENKMEDALKNDEFLVYLQPKYKLSNESICGAEALARWKNDSKELFFPDVFIPVFESNGFITKLDKHMLGKVCEIIRGWLDQGIKPVVVSVNFSRLHLSNRNFVEDLCEIVDSYGIDHRYIEIEITETVIYDNIDILGGLLDQLHADGFTMSMDDFGSGYSSLSMLQNLPVDVIKMDRRFFVNQRDAKRSKTVVGSVIDMAEKLGTRIVAEGVEEKEHIDLLRELRCDMAQGYFFAKPMLATEFTELL